MYQNWNSLQMLRRVAKHCNQVHTVEIIFQFFKSPRGINVGSDWFTLRFCAGKLIGCKCFV
jgi:hypothetical protein